MSDAQVFWLFVAILLSGPSMGSVAKSLDKIADGLNAIAKAIKEKR